jgi:CrcB protein
MMFTAAQIAIGGATGAVLRYLAGVGVMRLFGPQPLPLGVLFVNIAGSLAMGMLVTFLGQRGLTQWNAFLATGVLGGFTTFSSFSLEAWRLLERGDIGLAGLYVGLSVAVSLMALVAGVYGMRWVLA